jgi:peroxiredoxin
MSERRRIGWQTLLVALPGVLSQARVLPALVLLVTTFVPGCTTNRTRSQVSDAVEVGQQAPDFEFEPVGGEPMRLSELRGKPVIVNFFATWCGPCMMELPELDSKLAKPLKDQGLVVIAFGIGETPQKMAELRRSTRCTYLVVPDSNSEIFEKFAGSEGAIPQSYLIRPDGTVDRHLVGYSPQELASLKKRVQELLKESK